jgi:hypothetical protein
MMNDMMNNTVSFEDAMMADESWREESCSHLDEEDRTIAESDCVCRRFISKDNHVDVEEI